MDKQEAWGFAMGLISIENLRPSEDFLGWVEQEKAGTVTLADIKTLLDAKYLAAGKSGGRGLPWLSALFFWRDSYVYHNTKTLRNRLNIRERNLLCEAEANYTSLRLRELVEYPPEGAFDYAHFCAVHYAIFQDLFAWAGKQREMDCFKREQVLDGKSIEYTKVKEIERAATAAIETFRTIDWPALTPEQKTERFATCMAELWKVHTFRDGNTRTVVTFCLQYAELVGMPIDRMLFDRHKRNFRDALVKATAVLTYFGDRSDINHLIGLIAEGLEARRS